MAGQVAAAGGQDAMEIDTHVARAIKVDVAKTKTRVPTTTDIINASRILRDPCNFPPESDASMTYCSLLADTPPVPRKVAPGVSVSTVFADIDDFKSKLWACFHSNSNLPGVIMGYATGLYASSPTDLTCRRAPPSSSPRPCGVRSTCSRLVHRRYDDFTVVGVIQACVPNHSAQVALEAAGRRANKPIDSGTTIYRHLEAIDLELAAVVSGKRKHAATPRPSPTGASIRVPVRSPAPDHAPLSPRPPIVPTHAIPRLFGCDAIMASAMAVADEWATPS
eukprot:jgi/Tetstr1/456605/TSEL_043308.t1